MGIENDMFMKSDAIESLPESPYRQKLAKIRHDTICPEIDKDNELLQFIIAHISPDEYLECVHLGFCELHNKILIRGGMKYKNGGGFHPCQYGFGKYRLCGDFRDSCDGHHHYFERQMLGIYADKEYVKKCVEKFKK